MLEFIRSTYRLFVLISFWVFLIAATIAGGIWGNEIGHPVIGVILGLIGGFILDILICGLEVTLLNMDDNLERIARNMYHSSAGGASSGSPYTSGPTPYTNPNSTGPVTPVSGGTWTCKKCNEKNPATASSCKSCGAYK